jgi:hypothetical protein
MNEPGLWTCGGGRGKLIKEEKMLPLFLQWFALLWGYPALNQSVMLEKRNSQSPEDGCMQAMVSENNLFFLVVVEMWARAHNVGYWPIKPATNKLEFFPEIGIPNK